MRQLIRKFLKRDHLIEHISKFFSPIAAVFLLLIGLYVLLNRQLFLGAFSIISLELFSPFSVEASAPIGAVAGLDIFSLIFILVFVNVAATLFVLWNFELLKHVPKLGKYLDKFDKRIVKLVKKHRLEHISFFGLFLYFLSPLQASGAFTVAIIGKLLHMEEKKILFIVIIGTIIGVLIFSSPIYGIKLFFRI